MRSDMVKKGIGRAPHRALFKAIGLSDEELERPLIGIVTSQNDMRVTKVGNMLRSCRLDELPQLINILLGDMSFVGTRPEVPRYVAAYTDEMKATLLLPAGVTSVASIAYKDEDQLLQNAQNVDEVYINEVLPGKMAWNLRSIKEFSFLQDIKTMIDTVLVVLR